MQTQTWGQLVKTPGSARVKSAIIINGGLFLNGKMEIVMKSVSATTTRIRLPKNRKPTHPGEILLEELLNPMGVSQAQFAKHLGWTQAKLNEIIKGKRGVTSETALAFSDALGTSPDIWLDLQQHCDLYEALQKHQKVPKFKVAG